MMREEDSLASHMKLYFAYRLDKVRKSLGLSSPVRPSCQLWFELSKFVVFHYIPSDGLIYGKSIGMVNLISKLQSTNITLTHISRLTF